MRKIEKQMNEAVANNKNWQSANTSVHFERGKWCELIVRLHGNKIAEIGDNDISIFDGGWQTTTTKSRLNALCDRFCNAVTDGVFQKDYHVKQVCTINVTIKVTREWEQRLHLCLT